MTSLDDPEPDPSISDAVSQAVRMGYDVIAENIKQGREAAKRFGQGEYHVREVPGDLETAGLRVLQVARTLSTTALDVCETLLRELGSALGAPDQTAAPAPTPGFRPVVRPVAPTPAPSPDLIKLDVVLLGDVKAVSRTEELSRPEQPTLAADIFATPLASPDGKAQPILNVVFRSDGAAEGLVAAVPIPDGQPAGVYSGIVFAKGQGVPLGMLTVEVTA